MESLAPEPIMLAEGKLLSEAISSLNNPKAYCLVVVGADSRLRGLFTEESVLQKILGRAIRPEEKIGAFMDQDIHTIEERAPFAKAIDLMGQKRLKYLPVCSSKGYPVGVFSVRWLMGFIAGHFSRTGGSLETDSEQEKIWKEVVNLPISFVLTAHGRMNCAKSSPNQCLGDVEKLFRETRQQASLVFDNGHLIGLIRLQDLPFNVLCRDRSAEKMLVRDFMTKPPLKACENDSIISAIRKLSDSGLPCMVFDAEDETGVVSAGDIVSYIYNHIHDDE